MYILILHTKGGLISERFSLKSPKKRCQITPPKENMELENDLAPFFDPKWKLFEIKPPLVLLRLKLVFFELNESVHYPV